MKKRIILLMMAMLFLVIAILAGCSSEETAATQESSAAQEELSAETVKEEPAEETEAAKPASITDEEVLFDFYSIPADWPKAVPLHTDMKVTSYERTENSMLSSGYCTYDMAGINNFYTNARKEVGGGYPWEWDTANTSVIEGPDQVFYFVSQEGQSLIIKFAEVEDGILGFELDYKE